jgi:hypothetical protein
MKPGKLNVAPHAASHLLYRSLDRLDDVFHGDGHRAGLNGIDGQFDFDEARFVNGEWYYLINNGKGLWSGSIWVEGVSIDGTDGTRWLLNIADGYDGPRPLDPTLIDVPPDEPPPDEPPPPSTSLPPHTGTNLLLNGGFEGATYRDPEYISNLLPDKWVRDMVAIGNQPEPNPNTDNPQPWFPPEIVVMEDWRLTPDLRPIPNPTHLLHGFKGFGPMWFRMAQTVSLTAGNYKLYADVFLDPVVSGEKVRPSSPDAYLACEFALGSDTLGTGWLDGRAISFGRWTRVEKAFTASSNRDVKLWFMGRGRWGLQHNGLFVDNCWLERISDTPPAPFMTFAVDDTVLAPGECTFLRWTSGNINSIFLNGEGVTGNEIRQVCPTTTTMYTLVANHVGGQLTEIEIVTVESPPPTDDWKVTLRAFLDAVLALINDLKSKLGL